MICTTCGNTVDSLNRFCPKCGAPVQAQSPQQYVAPPPYTSPQPPMMGGPAVPPARKSSCGKIILILAIILLVLGGGLAAVIYFGYHKLEETLKSSEAYQVAFTALKENAEVNDQLGDITETGFPLGAYSQNADGTGDAAFVMSVKGSKESGRYEANLIRRNSVWRLTKGVVTTNSGQHILVTDSSEGYESNLNSNTNTDTDTNTNDIVAPGKTISGGVLNSKAISLPKPSYPQIAKQANASGTVVVQVVVDERGNVTSASAVSGHPLLRGPAVAAAREAKFYPTKLNGKPVKVTGVITYNFTPE